MPPVHGENDQDEEIRGEGERFGWRHAGCATRNRHDYSSLVRRKSRNRPLRPMIAPPLRMTASDLRRLLDEVRTGAVDPDDRGRAHPRGAARGAVRGPGLRPRRHPSRTCGRASPRSILGMGKTPAQIAAIAERIVARASRCSSRAPARGVRRRPRWSFPERRITRTRAPSRCGRARSRRASARC